MSPEDWDVLVASGDGHIYQTYHWAKLAEYSGAQAVPLVSDGSVMMAYQSTLLSARRLGFRMNGLRVDRGPVFKNGRFDTQGFADIVDRLNGHARKNDVVVCHFSPSRPYSDRAADSTVSSRGFAHIPNLHARGYHTQTLVVDLGGSVDRIFNRMEKRTRWSIRKAERSAVSVQEKSDEDGLQAFYSLYCRTVPSPSPIVLFSSMLKMLGDKGFARVFIATVGSSAASAAFVLLFGRTMWYTWGGSDFTYHSSCATSLLHWHIMQWGKQNGYRFYDLGGALIDDVDLCTAPSKMVTGTLFKRGFGGAPVKYLGQYTKVYRKALSMRSIKCLSTVARTIHQARTTLRI